MFSNGLEWKVDIFNVTRATLDSIKVCSSAMPKAVTAASSVHDFCEVNPQWHRGAGEPEIGRALPKIKQTYEEMIDFIAKKVENMLRSEF